MVLAVLGWPVLATLALPWALGTGAGKRWLVGRANALLAPSRLELAAIKLSWFGPTRMTGVVLRDAAGDAVLTATAATLDRNLAQILFQRPRLGTLRIDRAGLDIERAPDGTIDLYETLKPVIGRDPRTSIRIEIPDGRLRFRADGVMDRVVAEHAAVSVVVAPEPGPVSWRMRLGDAGANTLALDGRFFRGAVDPAGGPDLDVRLAGHDWPWSIGGGAVRATGRLDGGLDAQRAKGTWHLKGDANFGRVEVSGTRLAGDVLRVDRLRGVWDLDAEAARWTIRRFEVDSTLAMLKAESGSKLVGRLDLAGLAAQLPHALRLREGVSLEQGTADVRVETRAEGGASVLDVSARISDLRASDHGRAFTLHDPATLTALLRRGEGTVAVERLTAETPYLRAEARGDLLQGVTLTGTVDLTGLQRQLRDLLDLGSFELAGRGDLTGRYKAEAARFQGRLGAELRGVKVAGVGPVPVDRPSVELTLVVEGRSDRSGVPVAWESATSRLTSGDVAAEVSLRSGGPSLAGSVAGPLAVGGRAARVEGRFEGRGDDRGFAFDSIALSLVDTDTDGGRAPYRLAATGRYDRAGGELTLSPAPAGAGRAAAALGAEGLRVSGLNRGAGLRVDGGLVGDLTALTAWLPGAPVGLRGTWSARASSRSGEGGLQLGARIDLKELAWGPARAADEAVPRQVTSGESVGLAVRAFLPDGGKRLDVTEFAVSSRFVTVEAAGRVDDPSGKPVAELTGKISPDWDALTTWLGGHVEPAARVDGRPRAFRLRAPLGSGWRDGLDGELGVAIAAADVYGLRLGATDVVVRARRGRLAVDPIDTSLNGGHLRLVPAIRTGDEKGGPALLLSDGSVLEGANVNDEVSRRVLSFVAPVLNNATRVSGRVSADIDEAVFPLHRGAGEGATVKGAVVFQDVKFVPGGTFRDLFARFGWEDRALIRIDEPVSLEIADRRVYQRGLVVPIGRLTQIEMDGWVGFDRDLNLTISVPVLPTALADKPLIGGIAARSRVRIPIRGTMDHPEVDPEAFKLGMKELGKSVLEEGVPQGVLDLLKMFQREPDPNAPPPPPRMTPQEKKARRQEKKADRRARRGLLP